MLTVTAPSLMRTNRIYGAEFRFFFFLFFFFKRSVFGVVVMEGCVGGVWGGVTAYPAA